MSDAIDKLLSVEFDRLPKTVQEAHFAYPTAKALVDVDDSGENHQLANPGELNYEADETLFPKLGIKSWRNGSNLGLVPRLSHVRSAASRLLRRPTAEQRLAAKPWIETKTPLKLYLFPYRNFSTMNEARFLIRDGRCNRISACFRSEPPKDLNKSLSPMENFALDIGSHLQSWSYIVEVAWSSGRDIGLVEVNPGLTNAELDELKAL